MVVVGGLCLSIAGVVLRHIEAADGWQILFYRAASFSVTVLVVVAVRHQGRLVAPFLAIGAKGLWVAVFFGSGSICYVFAMLLTTVANVTFMVSATPFFVAVLGWVLLGERVRLTTWIAMSVACAGVALMFVDGVATGHLTGLLVTLGIIAGYVGMLLTLRTATDVDMLPAICVAGVLTTIFSATMADGLGISSRDLGLCILLGTVQYGAGFILLTMGTRYVPAAEVALLALVETVLAPLWVWIGVGEVPSGFTLVGGAIVISAVVIRAVAGLHEHRQAHRKVPR